jgi:hypothetical protein
MIFHFLLVWHIINSLNMCWTLNHQNIIVMAQRHISLSLYTTPMHQPPSPHRVPSLTRAVMAPCPSPFLAAMCSPPRPAVVVTRSSTTARWRSDVLRPRLGVPCSSLLSISLFSICTIDCSPAIAAVARTRGKARSPHMLRCCCASWHL